MLQIFFETAHSISQIVFYEYGSNEDAKRLPPVLLHQILKMAMRELAKVIQRHLQGMIYHFDNECVDLLSYEFSPLKM